MLNIKMVWKVQETRHGWLCKRDAVASLLMVVSTWALLAGYGFSHTLALYCRRINEALSLLLCSDLTTHTCTLGSTSTADSVGVSTLWVQQLDLNISEHNYLRQQKQNDLCIWTATSHTNIIILPLSVVLVRKFGDNIGLVYDWNHTRPASHLQNRPYLVSCTFYAFLIRRIFY